MSSKLTVSVLRASDQTLDFSVKGVDASIANALRRTMIADVPTIAIDLVEVVENSSVLCDEFIAHRLGLIPLESAKASELFKPYEYDGDDDTATDVHLELNVKCQNEHTRSITSADLVCFDKRVKPVNFSDATIDPSGQSSSVLIAKLRKNQQLSVKCIARKGTGKDHAKWSPVATAVYKYEPLVKVDHVLLKTLSGKLAFSGSDLTQLTITIETEKMELARSDPSGMFRYDAENDKFEVVSNATCTFNGEIMKMVSIETRWL